MKKSQKPNATVRRMTVSVPPETFDEMEQVRKDERRSMSELIREIWRVYLRFRNVRAYTPTAAELRAIRRGRAQIERGESVTLDQLLNALDRPRLSRRAKGTRASRR